MKRISLRSVKPLQVARRQHDALEGSRGACRLRWTWKALICVLGVTVLPFSPGRGLAATTQQPDGNDQTNTTMEADDGGQPDDMSQTNDIIGLDGFGTTNEADRSLLLTKGIPSGNNRALRRRRSRRRPDSNGAFVVGDQTNRSASGRAAYLTFKIVTDNNIFDPNRKPGIGPIVRTPTRTTDTFAFKGSLSYEKGTFAIFGGSSLQYEKAMKVGDNIAGYQLLSVTPNAVRLALGTNEVELQVGMQMRRQDQGPWIATAASEAYAVFAPTSSVPNAPPGSPSGTQAVFSGPDSDILNKLKLRREQE